MLRYLFSFTAIAVLLASALTYVHLPGRQSELSAASKEAELLRKERLELLRPYVESALTRSGEAQDVRNLADAVTIASLGAGDIRRDGVLDAALAKLVSNPEIYPALLIDKEFAALHARLDEHESRLSKAITRLNLATHSKKVHNTGLMHRIATVILPAADIPNVTCHGEVAGIVAKMAGKAPELYSVAME